MKLSKKSIFWIILAFSFALRVWQIGRQSYWLDEMVSLRMAQGHIIAAFQDNMPFVYNLLLKAWIFLWGTGEAATRSLSLIFSCGTTAILFLFGDMIGGLTAAIVISFCHAVLFLSIQYAQETRSYAFFEFATALNMYMFFKLWRGDRKPSAYFASALLLAATHYLAAIPLLLQSLTMLAAPKTKIDAKTKKIIAGSAGMALLFLFVSYQHFFSWRHLEWQKTKFEVEPLSHDPGGVLWPLANANWLTAAALLLLLISTTGIKSPRWPFKGYRGLFLNFILVPIIGVQVCSILFHRALFLPRYFIYLSPYLAAWAGTSLLALATNSRTEKRMAYFLALLFLAGTVWSLPALYIARKSPWKKAAAIVGLQSDNMVLTTCTLALATPYFEEKNIAVTNLDLAKPQNLILEALKDHQNVWIIENYYGGIQYLDKLQSRLSDRGCSVKPVVVAPDGVAEPVLMLRVQKGIKCSGPS